LGEVSGHGGGLRRPTENYGPLKTQTNKKKYKKKNEHKKKENSNDEQLRKGRNYASGNFNGETPEKMRREKGPEYLAQGRV